MTIKRVDKDTRTPEERAADDAVRRWLEKWKTSNRWALRELQRKGNQRALSRSHASMHPPEGWSPEKIAPERKAELRAWTKETVYAVCCDPPGAGILTRSWLQRFLPARANCPDELFWAQDWYLAREILNPALAELVAECKIEERLERPIIKTRTGEIKPGSPAPTFRKLNVLEAIARAAADEATG